MGLLVADVLRHGARYTPHRLAATLGDDEVTFGALDEQANRIAHTLAGIGVGLSSSVLPYLCDQLAMARLPRATYALLVSLLPATAALVGVVVLAQVPSATEAAGVALVVAGVALRR